MIIHHPPPPPPPPIVQNCEYQIEISTIERTYQCFSREEYEKRQQAQQAKEAAETQAFTNFFLVWWHDVLILLGLGVFFFIGTH